jgi:hypothetical protein
MYELEVKPCENMPGHFVALVYKPGAEHWFIGAGGLSKEEAIDRARLCLAENLQINPQGKIPWRPKTSKGPVKAA